MGLDISAYRQLNPAPGAEIDEDGNPVEAEYWKPGAAMDWSEQNWPGRASGVPDSNAVYSFAEEFDFRAGSYSGYNYWRKQLALMAGWKSVEEAWAAEHGPFFELINFADNEGVIGPEVAAKLAKDFVDFDDRARIADPHDGYFYEKYQLWRRAFEMAADGGAVCFH